MSSSSSSWRTPIKRRGRSRSRSTIRYGSRSRSTALVAVRRNTVARPFGYNPNQIYRYMQIQNMLKASINVSTGGATFTNSTGSVVYCGSNGSNTTADSMFSTAFALSDCPNYTAFTALYDRYRITKIDVTFGPVINESGAIATTYQQTQQSCQVWYCVDHDDASVLTNIGAIQAYGNVKVHNCLDGKDFGISFKPRIATAAFGGSVFTAYANQADLWLDCASPSVPYYGLKWGMPCPLVTGFATPALTLRCRYYLEFKDLR